MATRERIDRARCFLPAGSLLTRTAADAAAAVKVKPQRSMVKGQTTTGEVASLVRTADVESHNKQTIASMSTGHKHKHRDNKSIIKCLLCNRTRRANAPWAHTRTKRASAPARKRTMVVYDAQ